MSEKKISIVREQLSLEYGIRQYKKQGNYVKNLIDILSNDLDFHSKNSSYASHNFHSFPAKFPPQLPLKFITDLTDPNEIVLDPMMGSGTTILEAYLTERKAIGFDIDPLALLIARVKTTPLKLEDTIKICRQIIESAQSHILHDWQNLERKLAERWDLKTKYFIDY